jgi:hypothetical protein
MPSPRHSLFAAAAIVVMAASVGGCSSAVTVASPAPPGTRPSRSALPTASATNSVQPAGTPAPSADASVVRACPVGPTTLEDLIGLRLDGGPLSDRYLNPLNERALACFDGATLAFTAFLAAPEGLGGTVAYQLTPAWIDTWNSAATFLAASDQEAAPGAPSGPFLPVAVPPDVRASFDRQQGRWATVTGRLDAPLATTCVATPPSGPDVPAPADLVDMCRTSLVLDSIAPGSDPCPAKASLEAIVATPEAGRADCFGGAPVSFVAAGSSINNVWPGMTIPSGYRDWIFGADGLATDASLAVFVPDTMPLPGPAGTPWANRDTIGGPDAFWQVVGHFDDPLAEACLPAAGDTLETPAHDVTEAVLSKGEVHAFCRNHLVVDRLTWLPDATASSVPG